MQIDLREIPCFGIAGNFTGHLEQAGEADSFKNVKTSSENEPKAVFPTYIPYKDEAIPEFLNIFPFSSRTIVFPEENDQEQNLQIESECAIVFDVVWENDKISALKPLAFAAGNDCSIRRKGLSKISWKKNWGANTKGFSSNSIPLDSFSPDGNISKYRIKSFLIRAGSLYEYGEDSRISDYSYIYQKLLDWLVKKINEQTDFESAENVLSYLQKSANPSKIMVSIGATRYTDFGQKNFLKKGDFAAVILYPEDKYSGKDIEDLLRKKDCSASDISFLLQEIV
ncbi:MAG: DUF5718 family protein [Treponema sp.]|nr:DUF5718 family protein [Treponema sp.]